MYSAIPVPQFDWERKDMRYAMLAFPLVGAVIALIMSGTAYVLDLMQVPELLKGAFFTLIPVWVTGGIHLDGYADTCDACASHREPEKKQEILKDPHIGSFAVIRLCGLFLLEGALWASLPHPGALFLGVLFVLSRIQSAFAVVSFPLAKNTGLAYVFAEASDRKNAGIILAAGDIVISAAACFFGGLEGAAMILASHGVFAYYYYMSRKQFGGLSGDLAGWFLVQAEKWMLIAAAAVFYLKGVL